MALRKSIVITIIAVASLFATAAAFAGGNDYALSASPQSQFVSPGEDATVNWLAWNNTEATASCEVSIQELGVTIWSGDILAASTVGGQVSIPVLDRNSRFTFELICNGSSVAKRAINVKVR